MVRRNHGQRVRREGCVMKRVGIKQPLGLDSAVPQSRLRRRVTLALVVVWSVLVVLIFSRLT